MTAKASAAILFVTLGVVAALAVTEAPADPPMGSPPTVYVTQTVEHRIQGKGVRWWSAHAVQARREANAARLRASRLHRRLITHVRAVRAAERPTVAYAIRLASRVFGVSETQMRSVAWCESRYDPYAANGQYLGIFQMHWSPFGFSPYDPVAAALSTAQTVAHEGWRQWQCKP